MRELEAIIVAFLVIAAGLIGLVLVALGLVSGLGYVFEGSRLKENYSIEAVRAIALDAVRRYGTSMSPGAAHSRWSHETTPCLIRSGPGQTEALPVEEKNQEPKSDKGLEQCRRFFISDQRDHDPDAADPAVCFPALVFASRVDRTHTHSVVVVDGADTADLSKGVVSAEARQRLLKRYRRPRGFSKTLAFVGGGGLDGVVMQLVGQQQCDGFQIFSYRVQVSAPRTLRTKLEAHGYHVGLK